MTKVRDLDQVLEVAARVFGERGYEATRLHDIAEELGILKGSLYYYTSSKAELFYLVNCRRLEALLQRAIEVADSDAPAIERLEQILRMHLRSIDEFYPESSQWFVRVDLRTAAISPRGAVGDPRTLHHDYEALIARLLEDGRTERTLRTDIDTRVAALGLIGACNWLTYWYRQGGRLNIDEVSDTLLAFLLDGLRTPRVTREARGS